MGFLSSVSGYPAMVSPPDTEITCPVMNAASSEARKWPAQVDVEQGVPFRGLRFEEVLEAVPAWRTRWRRRRR